MGNRPPQSTSGRRWPRDVRDLFRSTRRSNGADVDRNDFSEQPRSNRLDGQGHVSGQRSGSNGRKSWRDKLNSCPDLQGAAAAKGSSHQQHQQQQQHQHQYTTTQPDLQPPTKLNYKIYRSYGDLPPDDADESESRPRSSSRMASCADIPIVEVRVYRRSTETLSVAGDRRRTQSLPRGMDLRRSLGSDLAGATTGSGSSGDSRHGSTSLHGSHYTDVGGGGGYSRSTSRKASARSSVASIGARVSAEEFPDNSTVRRKLEEFERSFTSTFIDAFKCLAPLNQMAALCVASRPDRANQAVSLLQYLESDAVPVDMTTATVDSYNGETREFCLTIALARYPEVQRLKVEGPAAMERRLAVCQELAEDMARDAARELSRMFEYQLSLINEQIAFRLLARQAVDCILNATRRRSRILDANALVRGVIRGRPPNVEAPMFISVFVGNKELKWNLNELFKKPALRRELIAGVIESNRLMTTSTSAVPSSVSSSSVFTNGSIVDDWRTDFYRAPWRYFTSPRCDPMKYGYRGQMVERDYVTGGYRLNAEDESFFQEEVTIRYDDFHRIYSPLRRLVGVDTLCDYCACAINEQQAIFAGNDGRLSVTEARATGVSGHAAATGLVEYVRCFIPGESYSRDEVDIVLRPLGVALPETLFTSMTSYTPTEVLSLVRDAVIRKQSGSRVTANGNGNGNGIEGGLSRAAIEVTRACDELSGRLQGEFSWTVNSPVDGTPISNFNTGQMDSDDIAHLIERRSRCSNPADDRTTVV